MEHLDRNFDGIEFEEYRKKVDAVFNALHDSLEDAYYKNWKIGKSSPWQGYDVQLTPAESKTLFDKLHGLIWAEHLIALKAEHDTAVVKDSTFDRITTRSVDREAKDSPSPYEKAVMLKTNLSVEGINITV